MSSTANSAPEAPWTSAEDALILEQRNQRGHLWVSIAVKLPGRQPEAIRKRYDELMYRRLHGRAKPVPRDVKCLAPFCGKMFRSPDPKRYRRCPDCTKKLAGITEAEAIEHTDIEGLELPENEIVELENLVAYDRPFDEDDSTHRRGADRQRRHVSSIVKNTRMIHGPRTHKPRPGGR